MAPPRLKWKITMALDTLANSACRHGRSAHYVRLPRLLQDLHIARADGSYGKLLTRLAKYAVLIIDDWGLAKFNDKERRDILEVLEDRHDITSTIISSQIPVDKWHDSIGDPTIADAVLAPCVRIVVASP